MEPTTNQSLASLLENVRLRAVMQATFTIIGVVLAFLLIYRFFYILFAVLVAIMLYLAIRPLVEKLNRIGVNKRVGMIVGYITVIGLLIAFLVLLIPMILGQARAITERGPEYYALLKALLIGSDMSLLKLIAGYLPAEFPAERIPKLLMPISATQDAAATVANSTLFSPTTLLTTLFLVIGVFAMAYYWMRDRDKIIYQFLLFFPVAQRDVVEKLIGEMEEKVGDFYQGQLILCTLVGGVSFIAYWLIGLPYALTLGLFAFIFEAVPLIGPLLGAIPAILIALTISPTMTLAVIAINSSVQFLENNLLVPRVMDHTVGVHPIVTVMAIVGFTSLFGVTGALLAIPLAAILQVLFERIIFHFRSADDAATMSTNHAPQINQRNRFSIMRIEAQELANDIRRRMRQKDIPTTSENAQIEEMIESFALELDQLMAQHEDTVKGSV